jgi:hypothetical protein
VEGEREEEEEEEDEVKGGREREGEKISWVG